VSVPDVVCGRLPWANFVGGGLDPVGSVGAEAELFVFKGSAGDKIDDGVGAVEKVRAAQRSSRCGRRRADGEDENGCCWCCIAESVAAFV
jgi:hypothetical protein